jgi:hypothetical protein
MIQELSGQTLSGSRRKKRFGKMPMVELTMDLKLSPSGFSTKLRI